MSEILFEEGLIGVPRARRFELLEQPDSQVLLLRSLDIAGFNVPVVDPFLADADYSPRFGTRVLRALELEQDAKVLLLAVTTLGAGGPTANLRAPLVVNVEQRRGMQVILDDKSQGMQVAVDLGRQGGNERATATG